MKGVLMNIGERLRYARKKRGIGLKDVSQATDLSVSFISDLERGKAKGSVDSLEVLSRFYEIPLSQLFDNEIGFLSDPGFSYEPSFLEFKNLHPGYDPEILELLPIIEQRSDNKRKTIKDWEKLYNVIAFVMRN
jgi:transcriptional regulator with XRE-family HTH domain